jgi:hypothetical protein
LEVVAAKTTKKESTICQPYLMLKDYLSRASIIYLERVREYIQRGTSIFGIGVMEMMTTGLVTVAQDLGGPKSDIIASPWDLQEFANDCGGGGGGKRPTRCLASTAEELPMQCIQLSKGVQEKRLLLFNRVVIGMPRRDFRMKCLSRNKLC